MRSAALLSAAAAFCAVSLAANLWYSLSLGTEPLDKAIYAAASVAADVFKIGLPLQLLALWAKRDRLLSVTGFVLWLMCFGWSLGSAVGFALSSRAETVAERVAARETRDGWEATVHRATEQLSALGGHRPIAVIEAELAATTVPPHIRQRTNACAEVTLPESQAACAPTLRLRKELAAAEAAARLESRVEAGREKLDTLPVAGSSADPQVAALARLTGRDEGSLRTGFALFLAALIEAGSALGFTLVSAVTGSTTPPAGPGAVGGAKRADRRHLNPAPHGTLPISKPTVSRRLDPPPLVAANDAGDAVGASKSSPATLGRSPVPAPSNAARPRAPQPTLGSDGTGRWALTRLALTPSAGVRARAAYEDYCRWSRAEGIVPCSETRFGRAFTARIRELGGRKVRRRDGAYYVGVSLAASQPAGSHDQPRTAKPAHPPRRPEPNGTPWQRWLRWLAMTWHARREVLIADLDPQRALKTMRARSPPRMRTDSPALR
jgi:hypothetical protein